MHSSEHRQRLHSAAATSSNKTLQATLQNGIGFHHAGRDGHRVGRGQAAQSFLMRSFRRLRLISPCISLPTVPN